MKRENAISTIEKTIEDYESRIEALRNAIVFLRKEQPTIKDNTPNVKPTKTFSITKDGVTYSNKTRKEIAKIIGCPYQSVVTEILDAKKMKRCPVIKGHLIQPSIT